MAKGGTRAGAGAAKVDNGLPLLKYVDLPQWLKAHSNEFIRTGYRCDYSWSMVFRSLWSLHNETGNVWTHLIGFLIFVALSVQMFTSVLKISFVDYTIFIMFLASSLMCMACSTMFHLGCCRSEKIYDRLAFLDFFGISMLIVFSTIPVLYYSLQCNPRWQAAYIGVFLLLGVVGIAGPFFEYFHRPEMRLMRVALYVLMVTCGLFPTIHIVFLLPYTPMSIPLHTGVALMFLLYGAGVLIYATRVPERWYPGRFDIWGHSHQIWHMFVLTAAVVHFFTCLGIYQRWEGMTVHC